MPAPIRRVDELGFPLPGNFEDQGGPASRRPQRTWGQFFYRYRWGVLLLLLPLLFGESLINGVRQYVAHALFIRANVHLDHEQYPEALASANRALFWEPETFDRWQEFEVRARIRYKMQDLQGSVEDLSETIRLLDVPGRARQFSDRLCDAYALRAWICELLGRHPQAIADSNTALSMAQDDGNRAILLNQRAYIRALANTELEQALDDVNRSLNIRSDDAGVIDTRAYVLFRLGKYDAASKEIDDAISRWTKQVRVPFWLAGDNGPRLWGQFDERQARQTREYWEDLAVMYHHRGEIRKKLGQIAAGDEDLHKADAYGYSKERGVY